MKAELEVGCFYTPRKPKDGPDPQTLGESKEQTLPHRLQKETNLAGT